ncbi:hypothetical protein FACS1894202_10380 [Clostridia bacterium]|nr:hypothetical protein FACS1894202_10380 [Clostridia bacterium]
MTTATKPKNKRGKRVEEAAKPVRPWIIPAVTVTAAVLLLAVSVVAFVLAGYARIYPNVYADGVKLGGMTAAQANQTLLAHIEPQIKGFALTVTAGELSETFTAENTGAVYSAGDAAEAAHDVGRSGGLLKRLSEAGRAFFGRVEVPVSAGLTLSDIAVRTRVAEIAAAFDKPAKEYTREVTDSAVIVQIGQAGRAIEQDKLRLSVTREFTALNFAAQTAPFTEQQPKPLDLKALRDSVFVAPKDAYLDVSDSENPEVRPHVTGTDFDVAALKAAIDAAIANGETSASVPILHAQPDVTQSELQARLFSDELASFTTYLSASNVPRTSNIRLAAQYMNGTILLPGGEFSYNEIVGKRTPARGFQEAGAYLNGKLVPETGGGICQLSSTLYNAVLLADLEITERTNHSMTVSYLPVGMDATVSWGTLDFKFKNNTGYPMKAYAEQSGNYVKVTLMGTKTDGSYVSMERVQISSTQMETIEKLNPQLAPGSRITTQDGHTGYVVETYRNVYDAGGNLLSRTQEAKSRYRKVDKIVEVGPAPVVPPEVTPTPTPEPLPIPSADPDPDPEPVPGEEEEASA